MKIDGTEDIDTDELDTTEGTGGNYPALSPNSPYASQLSSMLDQYSTTLKQRSTERKTVLQEAEQKLLARINDPMDQAATYFKLASAFGKPTRTGGFGETLSNVAGAAGEAAEERSKKTAALEDLRSKYKLSGLDQDVDDLGKQIGVTSKLAQLTQGKMGEFQQLSEAIKNLKPGDPQRALLEQRLRKLTYIKPSGEGAGGVGGKPQSPLGKIAADEGYAPGTPEFQKRVQALRAEGAGSKLSGTEQKELFEAEEAIEAGKTLVLNMGRALEINDKAYEGFGAGARRTIGRQIPGVKDSEGVQATTQLENLAGQNALSQLKAVFGGNPTEGERKILLDLEGSISMSAPERKTIYENAIKMANRRIKINQEKAKAIKAGAYSRSVEPEVDEKALGGLVQKYAFGGAVSMDGFDLTGSGMFADVLRSLKVQIKEQEALEAAKKAKEAEEQAAELAKPVIETDPGRNAFLPQIYSGSPEQDIGGEESSQQESTAPESVYRSEAPDLTNTIPRELQKYLTDVYTRGRSGERSYIPGKSAYAEGGSVEDTEGREAEEKAEFFKNAMRQYGPNGPMDVGVAGVTRPIAGGRGTAMGAVANNPADNQLLKNWIASYERPVAGANVRVGVNKPEGSPVQLLDVNASIPVGKGRAMAGVMGSRDHAGTHRDARMLGYQHPVAGGNVMMNLVKPSQGPVRYNVQAQIPFAKGGKVKKFEAGGRTNTSGDLSLANIGRAVSQGAGFSFGDEAIARVRAQMEGRPYEEVLAEERAAYKAFTDKYPYTALGTEIASGLIPTAAAMMIPGGQAPAVAGGAQMLTRGQKLAQLAKMSGTAGATGAISGAGASEGNMGDRMSEGLKTGATSALVAPIVAKTATAAGSGLRKVKETMFPTTDSVDENAVRKVLQAMGRDEMDVPDVKARMKADQKMGVKSTLADTTPAMTSLGEAVVTRPGAGRKKLGSVMEQRLEAGRDTAGGRAFHTIGGGQDYTNKEASLVAKLRSNANNAYDEAYSFGAVNDPRIMTVLEDNTFKKAYDEARNIASKEKRAAQLRGEDTSRFDLKPIYRVDSEGNITGVDVPDVRTLDYMKRGIDAIIDKGYSSSNGLSKAEAGALRDLKRAFVDVIDDATTVDGVSAYKAARQKYAGDREVLDALELGKDGYLTPKMLPAQAKKLVSEMSDAEKDALRAGVAQAILSKVGEKSQQVNAAQQIIGAPATKQRLEALFDNPAEYKLFEAALERESQLFRNAQDMMRGSRTANKTAALDDLKGGGSIFDIAGEAIDMTTAGPGSIMGRLLKHLQARTTVDEKTAARLADMLKAGTAQEVDDVFSQIEKQSGKVLGREASSRKAEQMTSGAIGASAGSPPSAPVPTEPVEEEDDEVKLQKLMNKYGTGEE